MKKMLSFIMIAALATSGLFAIDLAPPLSAVNVGTESLNDIVLVVDETLHQLPYAVVRLKYDTVTVTDTTEITNDNNGSDWHIQDAVATGYTTDIFNVEIDGGVINASGVDQAAIGYTVSVTPGAFSFTDGGGTITASDGTNDIKPTVFYDGGMIGTGSVNGLVTSFVSPILSNDFMYINKKIAQFKLQWTSASYLTYLNPVAVYKSTTAVEIKTTT